MNTQEIRVFVVEDNPMFAYMLEEIIKTSLPEAEVEIFATGEECEENLYKMPSIILLDHQLGGGVDGLYTLKRIKGFDPDIFVIYISSQTEIQVATNVLKYGAFDYIIKNDDISDELRKTFRKIAAIFIDMEEAKRKKRWSLFRS